jgi:hypothetical protein
MIKMNFDNRLDDEDKQLIQLLKEETMEFPSDQFVERAMTRISALQTEKKFVHKPLRVPLYIMALITILLLTPFLFPKISHSSSLNPLSEFLVNPETSILKYVVWCWLSVVVLWISGILFQIQSKFDLSPLKR